MKNVKNEELLLFPSPTSLDTELRVKGTATQSSWDKPVYRVGFLLPCIAIFANTAFDARGILNTKWRCLIRWIFASHSY